MSREVTGPLPPTPSPSFPSPPFFSYRLCFFSGFSASVFYFPCFSFSDSPSSLSLFIGHPSFGNILFSFEFKPGSGLRHCGSLRFAESTETTVEELERHSKVSSQTQERGKDWSESDEEKMRDNCG